MKFLKHLVSQKLHGTVLLVASPFFLVALQPQVAPAPASAVDAGGKTGHHFSNLGEMLEITKMPTNLVLGCPIGIGIAVKIYVYPLVN